MKLSMYNILTEKEDGTSILCNTHTLAVVALDQKHTKEYKLLDNGKEILDQEMLAQMFQAGLLINDDMNEKEGKRQIMRQSLNSTPPVMGGAASGIRPEDYLTMA